MSPETISAGPGGEQRQRGRDAAGGFERLGFARPANAHAERAPSPSAAISCVGAMRDVDDDVAKAGARERLDLPDDQRLAAGARAAASAWRRTAGASARRARPRGSSRQRAALRASGRYATPGVRVARARRAARSADRARDSARRRGAGSASRAACRRRSRPCRRDASSRAKMPSTFSCRCTPIHSKSRQNAAKSAPTGSARLARALPVADRPVELPLLVPLDVRVAQQRHEVVGDRPVDGVLEVEHARIGRRTPSGCANGSRDGRTRAAARGCWRARASNTRVERRALRRRRACAPRWRATYQSGKSASSRAQQRVVVGRQLVLARRALPAHQRVDARRRRARRAAVASSADAYVVRAEVGQQQEACAMSGASTRGTCTPAVRQQPRDVHERPAILASAAARPSRSASSAPSRRSPGRSRASRESSGGSSRRPMQARCEPTGTAQRRHEPLRERVGA